MGSHVSDELYALAMRPHSTAQIYPNCEVNGIKFVTCLRDDSRTTQNSGVRVPSVDGHDFYGKMEDVIVMKYTNSCRVILFKCQWFGDNDPEKRIH